MPLTTFFIDLDDTLYPPSTGIWAHIRRRMGEYMHERLQIPWDEIPTLRRVLFETYGTTMRGLQKRYQIDEEDFLAYVHDVGVDQILRPDPQLHQLLDSYPQKKIVFTNADRSHAERVLKALQIGDCFSGIVDIHAIAPACKPEAAAYSVALAAAGEDDPSRCLLLDDSPRNLAPARALGFCTVLVGSREPDPSACFSIQSVKELPCVVTPLLG